MPKFNIFLIPIIFFISACVCQSNFKNDFVYSSTKSFKMKEDTLKTPISKIIIKLPNSSYSSKVGFVGFHRKPSVWSYDEGCDYAWSLYGQGVIYIHSGVQMTLNITNELHKMDNPETKSLTEIFDDFEWNYDGKYFRYKSLDKSGSLFIYVYDIDKNLINLANDIVNSIKIFDE